MLSAPLQWQDRTILFNFLGSAESLGTRTLPGGVGGNKMRGTTRKTRVVKDRIAIPETHGEVLDE